MSDEMSTEEYLAIRKKAALGIDPRTAEIEWWYAQTVDPYGVRSEIPDECWQVGREYFARSPGSEVWVSFSDLPAATRDALWEKHKTKLAFPAGLNGPAGKRHEISTRRKEIMEGSINPEVFAEYLRSAKPRLISRVEVNGYNAKITYFISQVDYSWDEILDEGYDSKFSPLGCPVYWRTVKRGNEQLYCSTFLATRHQIIKGWGESGLAYCDPLTGTAAARIETSGRWLREGR